MNETGDSVVLQVVINNTVLTICKLLLIFLVY